MARRDARVIVHPWHWLDGDQTYSDRGDPVDGWSAYARIPEGPEDGGGFDVPEMEDFDTLELAEQAAREMAARHGARVCVEY